ncbi:uncharacterized protein LOC119080931 isoform X2 [Bradysia coprophila]|uniref:uncharacterized protein LOC119080931 isoform X2 n=1 Tax=Bradysia coprophila TaxID=38358 RepID=UPI00187D6EFE|nr:uncharacterized protein LOC119080931 isoform X2 [Bradysia coprophila]
MNILLISIFAVASLSIFPTKTMGTTDVQPEEPHALPLASAAGVIATQSNAGEIWQEDDREVLIRNERGTKNNSNGSACRYLKSPWSECDQKTNTRSRTLNLKKGEEGCVQTRTIQKKCKKACRYEKGTWSECANGQTSRSDKLKSTSDPTCQATREVNKNCNPAKGKGEKKERKNGKTDKGQRKSRA